jgi:hypothetical protein
LIIFQDFYMFADFFFHNLHALLNFIHLFVFCLSSYICLFTEIRPYLLCFFFVVINHSYYYF